MVAVRARAGNGPSGRRVGEQSGVSWDKAGILPGEAAGGEACRAKRGSLGRDFMHAEENGAGLKQCCACGEIPVGGACRAHCGG